MKIFRALPIHGVAHRNNNPDHWTMSYLNIIKDQMNTWNRVIANEQKRSTNAILYQTWYPLKGCYIPFSKKNQSLVVWVGNISFYHFQISQEFISTYVIKKTHSNNWYGGNGWYTRKPNCKNAKMMKTTMTRMMNGI